jgi:putative DNA primase/helicase
MQNITQNKPLNKPVLLNQHHIPAELKALSQFVVWKMEERAGTTKGTKIPYDAKTGRKAKSTDPQTWASFDVALQACSTGKYDGIGFTFDKGYSGVDLDNCRDPQTGEIELWAFDIVMMLDSYTEISPSGTGLHILLKAKLDGKGARRNGIELYDKGRYFTLTGQHLKDTPTVINDRQEMVSSFYKAIREIQAGGQEITDSKQLPIPVITLEDQDILEIARKASNRAKFERLWSGNISGYDDDQSRADLALVSMLCFYTTDDTQVERLWRQSGLYRAKLERVDYIERTISKARTSQNASYGGPTSGETCQKDFILYEYEDEGIRISEDPERNQWLFQVARNAGLIMLCYIIIMRLLGFPGKHCRLLMAVTAIGRERLNTFIASRKWLRKHYQEQGEASSESTIDRDIRELRADQKKTDVALLGYTPGSRFIDETGKEIRYASKFQNHILRYSLEAINIAVDIQGNYKNFNKALEAACKQVIEKNELAKPQEIKANNKKRVKTVKDLEQKISDLHGDLIARMIEEKWTESQIWNEYEKLQTESRLRFEQACARSHQASKSKFSMGFKLNPIENRQNEELEEEMVIK